MSYTKKFELCVMFVSSVILSKGIMSYDMAKENFFIYLISIDLIIFGFTIQVACNLIIKIYIDLFYRMTYDGSYIFL